YFTPLLAPSVNLHSNWKIKALYSFCVTISPPLVDSAPFEESTCNSPLFTSQPFSGKFFLYAPRQPWVVLPSNSSEKPLRFSASDRSFGIVFTTNTPVKGAGLIFFVCIRIFRQLICLPSSFFEPIA